MRGPGTPYLGAVVKVSRTGERSSRRVVNLAGGPQQLHLVTLQASAERAAWCAEWVQRAAVWFGVHIAGASRAGRRRCGSKHQ